MLGSLIGLLLALALVFLILGNMRLNKSYEFPADNLTIPTDETSIERGRHIAETTCAQCHGKDLGGVDGWFKMQGIADIDSSNLTTDQAESEACTHPMPITFGRSVTELGRTANLLSCHQCWHIKT